MRQHNTTWEEPRVLFIHGLLDRGTGFAKAAKMVHGITGYACTSVDRPGYGERTDVLTATTVADHARNLLDEVSAGPVVLVGHSYGGLIAIAAGQDPRVRSVIAFEPPAPWLPSWPETGETGFPRDDANVGASQSALRLSRRILGEERWEMIPEDLLHQWENEGPAVLADLSAMRSFDPGTSTLAWAKTTLLYGSASDSWRISAVETLASGYPVRALVTVPGAEHAAHVFQRRLFADAIAAALLAACNE